MVNTVKKKIIKKNKKTLDQRHMDKIKQLNELNNSLPEKKINLEIMQNQLHKLNNIEPCKYTFEHTSTKSLLLDNIEKTKSEIKLIEDCTDSLEYITNTIDLVVDYYKINNTEDDENVSNVNFGKKGGVRTIHSYLTKQPENIPKKNNLSKADIHAKYVDIVDISFNKNVNRNPSVCECGFERIISMSDGYYVCEKCAATENMIIATEKPNYKEPVQDTGTYAYKRINHFTEILSQLQGKESTTIPNEIIENILWELKKTKKNKNDLDIFELKKILKKLGYRTKYYEHISHILQLINGKEPPKFTRDTEATLKKMFKDIQKPFSLFCPKNRKNFLNYSYVLHKFCELLELDSYLDYFPLLKNPDKSRQHDKIWKKICSYMEWEFIKSI